MKPPSSLIYNFIIYILSVVHLVKLGGDCCFQQSRMIFLAIKEVKALTSQALPLMEHDCGTKPKMAQTVGRDYSLEDLCVTIKNISPECRNFRGRRKHVDIICWLAGH